MADSRITIKDLAKKLNLSTSTISRALHNHPGIGFKTRKEVHKLAAQLGYLPNSVASNLRRNKTNLLGIIVPRIDIHFHSRVISGIEEVAFKSGYNITIYQTNDSYEREVAITQSLLANMVDGVIGCLALNTKDCNHYTLFNKHKIPLVFYDRVCFDIESSRVIINDFEAAFKATEHLISIGCKRIAHIAGNQNSGIFVSRLEGYEAALKQNRIPFIKSLVCFPDELNYENGIECARKFTALPKVPDGIFCANDYTAIGAMQFLKRKNYRIPKDIAVVGFSNYPFSTIIEPSLTTIDDRAFEMGQAASRLLIQKIEDKNWNISSETVIIKTDLIIRESTQR